MKEATRTLCSTAPCPLQCAYCFAASPEYRSLSPLPTVADATLSSDTILYPSCDSEIHVNSLLVPLLQERLRNTQGRIFVSISTKVKISDRMVGLLSELNNELTSSGRGFIKLSISASAYQESNILAFERGAANFEDRLIGLNLASSRNIPVTINIKPILPQIGLTEYIELIDKSISITNMFMIGGLYCSEATEFGRSTIEQYRHLVSQRPVEWLPQRPTWPYIEDPEQMAAITKAIQQRGGIVFRSDRDAMLSIADRLQRHNYQSELALGKV